MFFKEKAQQIAEKLKVKEFNASDGWMEKLKKRRNLHFRTVHGEAGKVNREYLKEFQDDELKRNLEDFEDEDIYNADENGLNWKLLPDQTYVIGGNFYVYVLYRRF